MKVRLDFKTVFSSKSDTLVKKHLKNILQVILKTPYKRDIVSIILVGSVSHGEGTVWEKNGRKFILSDYDFFVVFKVVESQTRKDFFQLSIDITQRLAREGLLCHVDIVPVTEQDMNLSSSMMTVDLYHNGKTLWGKAVKKIVTKPSATKIEKDDAYNILFNRIGAQLQILFLNSNDNSKGTIIEAVYIYHTAKSILDALGSILAFRGQYTQSYQSRMDLKKKVLILQSFEADLKNSFEVKRAGNIERTLKFYKTKELFWKKSQKIIQSAFYYELFDLYQRKRLDDLLLRNMYEKRNIKNLSNNIVVFIRLFLQKKEYIKSFKLFFDTTPILLKIQTAMAYCFFSYNYTNTLTGKGYLSRASKLLNKQERSNDWKNITQTAINLWKDMIGHFDWMSLVIKNTPPL